MAYCGAHHTDLTLKKKDSKLPVDPTWIEDTNLRVYHLDWQTEVTVSLSLPYKGFLIPPAKSPSWQHTVEDHVCLQRIQHLINDIFVHSSSLDQCFTGLLELIPVLAQGTHTYSSLSHQRTLQTSSLWRLFPTLLFKYSPYHCAQLSTWSTVIYLSTVFFKIYNWR